ncbi:hypothetical protein HYX02_04105 [Candidatus Woesearchaeota archaeon]|nr:hypothetical protein [Candidatus Woesearchaeota archaeon]
MKKWLKEVARDLLAFGSIPFYFLVVIRAIIGKHNVFVYQMIIAAAVVFILDFIIKDSDMHVARALVAVFFTSLFYKEAIFTFFAAVVLALLLVSAYYVKRKIGSIIRGIIVGAISSAAGHYLTQYLI